MSTDRSNSDNIGRAEQLAFLIEAAGRMPGIFEAQAIYEHVEACEAVLNAAVSATSLEVSTTISNRTC